MSRLLCYVQLVKQKISMLNKFNMEEYKMKKDIKISAKTILAKCLKI